MAVIIPIKPIASPLSAPSTAPICMATEVPSPCDDAPNASPLAIRLSIPNTFITNGPTILPNIPTATTITAVNEGIPPAFSAIPIAIGVVTDFGWRVAINAWSAPIRSPITITLTMPIMAPTNTEVRIEITFPFRYCICSYKTNPNATTDGPSKKWIRWLPRWKDSYSIPIIFSTAIITRIDVNSGCSRLMRVFLYKANAAI